jgi:NTP pyrophosphatase (non-canonical NTP hydrolase)
MEKRMEDTLESVNKQLISDNFKELLSTALKHCHAEQVKNGWWADLATGENLIETGNFNVGEKLMLIVSEIAEAMEADRKNLMDDKLPHRKGIEVELADAIIRIGDLGGALGLDLAGAVTEKLEYNSKRIDHKPEYRATAVDGKRY